MHIFKLFATAFILITALTIGLLSAQTGKPDWIGGFPDGCTSVTVGKLASSDGSVYTSHTDDSHRTRSEIWMTAAGDHPAGTTVPMFKRIACDTTAMPSYANVKIGEIPQVPHTFGYVNSAYPCMNEHQLGIGESTFGGRSSLHSDIGLIDCQRLCQLMAERCTTAREAIRVAGELTAEHGWIDEGECLTIADKNEVWHLEIVGPGKGNKGSIWVAQRVPDDHVGVNANASTIKEIDLNNPDYFMASENIFQIAIDSGWWDPGKEAFRFCYAYAPESRTSFGSRRREWRVFDLLAPSLKLDANAENYPFSVKPDHPVTTQDLVNVFKDYYEGTPYNFIKDITVTDENGKTVISPLANPFMPYDMNKVFRINGGWGWMGERTIARWYTMYATIIQCRNWLPDAIGGVAWLAMDNVATSIYIPVYCCVTDLPQPYKTPGRTKGFTRESAWWAFNHLGTLAAQRWGDMRHDVDAVWNPWQKELFDNQSAIEQKAIALYNPKKPQATIEFLTGYTNEWGYKVVNRAWELGDFLWTKYDEKF
ncbi:MAG TPA: C69 family dipeptidase [Bacteroidales bacterium]|nr:C69 family dipeptidase [Bacteroidales bacterium]HNS47272.1 C69 family dipeptidase [Bacteroidales bacterium]